ncbi:nuclear transport factor 2 family protein [Nocardioides sp. BP30]|uniref:nuclear transport factor 2 family protein n=1 Tax=Nocardioides sp. BP30 TaxID=3036374 RepID=UPI002468EA96|nr:nuclear transport factor 2 family protein [Nocardioides sp. BP30]WGL51419.1 nuclear transport factor 2 family protein [Nocardioides sp. BP30]
MTSNSANNRTDRLQYLTDRIEIQDVIARYGLGQDLHEDGDNDVLREWDAVFAPEGRADYSITGVPDLADIGYRELVDFMRRPGGSMSGLKRWQHFQAWSTVEISGDTATARTPHIHTHQGETDGQGWNLIQTGMFVDRLERRPEGWRIVHRTLEILWMDTFPVAA